MAEDGEIKPFLVFKVIDDGSQVYPGLRRYGTHGHAVKATMSKELLCGAKNFAAGFRGTVGLGFTDCGHRFKNTGKLLRLA